MNPNEEEEAVTEEEIRLMVDIGEEKGAIEAAEKEMIENIFEFNNTTAKDVMMHPNQCNGDLEKRSAGRNIEGDPRKRIIPLSGLR